MELGTIIEFERVGEHRIGAVVGAVGKKKLIVLTSDGVEMRPRSSSVTFVFQRQVDASAGRQGVREHLEEVERQVAAAEQSVQVDGVWGRASADRDPYTIDELASLLQGEPTEWEQLAFRRALRRDDTYFRPRKRGWEPRTADEIAELNAQREKERERARERDAFVKTLAELLGPHDSGRDERIADAMNHPPFKERIEALQDYACWRGESPHWRESVDLLDSLEEHLGHPLRGSDSDRAFWVNVELGLWSEHERVELRRFRTALQLDEDARDQAESLAGVTYVPGSERHDFSDWWTCTIDDVQSRDLDDALSVRPRVGGGWEVAVHIADPSEWVPRDTPLDRHARAVATSVYLPTGVIPMFPSQLTEDVMSLVEGSPRPALSTIFTFSPHLELEAVELLRTTIVVDKRLDYGTVDHVLQGVSIDGIPADALSNLRHIADEFHLRRMEDGAIDIGLPETKLLVDLEGERPSARVAISSDSMSRSLVGEMMIAANVAAARFCEENDIPTIFRCQEPPDGDLLDDDIMAVPEGYAREFTRLKRMRRGTISTQPSRHAGLGVDRYVQSSSPIRRYTDLVVQRQIKAHLAGEPLPYDEDELEEVIGIYDRATYEASQMESDERDYWMTWLLGRTQGPIEAEVIDIRNDGSGRATVYLTNYGYRTECHLREPAPLGERVMLDVTRADPRHGALSLREARPG